MAAEKTTSGLAQQEQDDLGAERDRALEAVRNVMQARSKDPKNRELWNDLRDKQRFLVNMTSNECGCDPRHPHEVAAALQAGKLLFCPEAINAPSIMLVGYSGAGKSTLFTASCKALDDSFRPIIGSNATVTQAFQVHHVGTHHGDGMPVLADGPGVQDSTNLTALVPYFRRLGLGHQANGRRLAISRNFVTRFLRFVTRLVLPVFLTGNYIVPVRALQVDCFVVCVSLTPFLDDIPAPPSSYPPGSAGADTVTIALRSALGRRLADVRNFRVWLSEGFLRHNAIVVFTHWDAVDEALRAKRYNDTDIKLLKEAVIDGVGGVRHRHFVNSTAEDTTGVARVLVDAVEEAGRTNKVRVNTWRYKVTIDPQRDGRSVEPSLSCSWPSMVALFAPVFISMMLLFVYTMWAGMSS